MSTQFFRLAGRVAALLLLAASTVFAQATQRGMGRAAERQGLPPMEVERLFDGYVAMQAQEAVQLSDAQYPQFLAKLRGLQQVRRRHLADRRQALAELGKVLRATPVDEGQVREGLRRLRELGARNAEEIRKAYDAIDEVLDVAQQARFRLFEESVERRKFDLVLRARQRQQRQAPVR